MVGEEESNAIDCGRVKVAVVLLLVVSPFYYTSGSALVVRRDWSPDNQQQQQRQEWRCGECIGAPPRNEFIPEITFLQDMNYRSSASAAIRTAATTGRWKQ